MSTSDTLYLPDNGAVLLVPDNAEVFSVSTLVPRTYGMIEAGLLTYGGMEALGSYAALEVVV